MVKKTAALYINPTLLRHLSFVRAVCVERLLRICAGSDPQGRPYPDSNANVADGGIRKGTRSDEIRPITVPGHSLRYDLSAPPPASQVFATGGAGARQTMLYVRTSAGNLSPKLFHLIYR